MTVGPPLPSPPGTAENTRLCQPCRKATATPRGAGRRRGPSRAVALGTRCSGACGVAQPRSSPWMQSVLGSARDPQLGALGALSAAGALSGCWGWEGLVSALGMAPGCPQERSQVLLTWDVLGYVLLRVGTCWFPWTSDHTLNFQGISDV